MVSNSFKKVFSNLEKTIAKSTKQTIKRTGTSTKAYYAKIIAQDTGARSSVIKKRARIEQGTIADPSLTLSVATRVQMPAHEFSPKGNHKIATRLGARYGASYKLKNASRVQVPDAFLIKGINSGKELMVKRKGLARLPVATVYVDVFYNAVNKRMDDIKKHMADTFKKNFSSILKFNLDK